MSYKQHFVRNVFSSEYVKVATWGYPFQLRQNNQNYANLASGEISKKG